MSYLLRVTRENELPQILRVTDHEVITLEDLLPPSITLHNADGQDFDVSASTFLEFIKVIKPIYDKISTIKFVRTFTGLGLHDTVLIVDNV